MKVTMISCFRIALWILTSMMCSNSLYDIDFNLAKDKNYVKLRSDRSLSMSEISSLLNDELFRRCVSGKIIRH
jgi:hypothetical protein